MAEIVGLVASVITLAGAAATVSLEIYEFVDTVWHAKKELNDVAIEASDLSTVLDHLSTVLNQNVDSISSKTVQTAGTLIKRCENILSEIHVTIDLIKVKATHVQWLLRKRNTQQMKLSLETFKSTLSLMIQTVTLGRVMKGKIYRSERWSSEEGAGLLTFSSKDQYSGMAEVDRNISVLRSAILSNRRLVEQLDAAEESIKNAEPNETESTLDETELESKAIPPSVAFQHDYALATAPSSSLGHPVEAASLQAFREYDNRQHDRPASAVIYSSLPAPVVRARSQYYPSAFAEPPVITGERKPHSSDYATTDQEIHYLLTEWTNVTGNQMKDYLADPPDDRVSDAKLEKPDEPQVLKIKAWSLPNDQRESLIDCFSRLGGGYVWRHETQSTHWYYIVERLVLEYRIRRGKSDSTITNLQDFKTVISKQWVYKDTLLQAAYDFKEFGEGSYSIKGKLTPVSSATHFTALLYCS